MRDRLKGNFNALARSLGAGPISIYKVLTQVELEEIAQDLPIDEGVAVENILRDMVAIKVADPRRQPELRVRSPGTGQSGDYEFHADGSNPHYYADQLLCNYEGPPTEWISFEDGILQEQFLEKYKIESSEYKAKSDADILAFPLHSIWRHSARHKGANSSPFLHRAPEATPDTVPRLFLSGVLLSAFEGQ